MEKFTQFIEDSASDRTLAGEFWEKVSNPDFTNTDIRNWLESKGYQASTRQINKIGRIRDKVDQEFNVHDKDY
jgi:hypothetical protein